MNPIIRRWRWVCLYLLVLYAILPVVGPATEWARSRGMQWFVWYTAPALLAAAGIGVLVRAARGDARRFKILLALLAGAAVYYFLLATHLMEAPVERFHMVLFAGLALLVFRAFRENHRGARVYFYSAVFLACAGFVDEAVQGFMNDRLYDNRDILLNAASGLPVLVLCGALPGSTNRPVPATYRGRDLAAVLLLLSLGLAMFLLRRTPLDPDRIAGTWETAGDCGGMNRIVFGKKGEIEWNDDAGNWSRGRTSGVGNPFGEHILYIRIDDARNPSSCGWQKGWRGSLLLQFGDGYFTMYRHPNPWKRIDPASPPPVRQEPAREAPSPGEPGP